MKKSNDAPRCSLADIVDFLDIDHFCTDNYPKEYTYSNKSYIRERACLLINANCTNDKFMGLMRQNKEDNGDYTFTFPKEEKCKIIIPDDNSDVKAYYLLTCNSYNCILRNYEKKQLEPYEVDTSPYSLSAFNNVNKYMRWIPDTRTITFEYFPKNNKQNSNYCDYHEEYKKRQIFIISKWGDIAREFYKQYDEVELCNVDPEYIIRHFDNTKNPFDELKVSRNHYAQEPFDDDYDKKEGTLLKHIPEFTKLKDNVTIDNLDAYIDLIYNKKMLRSCTFLPEFEKRFLTFKNIFSFKNEHGECIMKAVKVYHAHERIFSLLAFTQWRPTGTTHRELYQIPIATGKQPLYNLDLLMRDREQDKIIVLTDSIETADYLQEKCKLTGVVFTSFLCEPGKYEQVDWKPLIKAADETGHLEIVYLITNHSGIELEDKYDEAEKLIEYLKNKENITINNFWQRRVEYPDDRSSYDNLEEFINATHQNPATVHPILEMDRSGFDEACRKAHIFQSRKPIFFDAGIDANTAETDKPEEKPVGLIPDFILYPILSRKDLTLLVGPQKCKKSLMALAISMIATNSNNQKVKPLFKEVIWNIVKNENGRHKVLYLDFENGPNEINRRIKSFESYYWPQEKEVRQECRDNLIVKVQGELPTKCTSTEGLSDLFKIIDEAKKQGNPDQEVDILIIDSLGGFNGNDSSASNVKEFKDALDLIRNNYPKMSTLMIHHSSTAPSKPNPARGSTASFDNFQYLILISNGDRDDELYVKIVQTRAGSAISKGNFKVICPEGMDQEKFKVIENYGGIELKTEDERDAAYKTNLKNVVNFLLNSIRVKRPEIANVLGMSERTLDAHLKK